MYRTLNKGEEMKKEERKKKKLICPLALVYEDNDPRGRILCYEEDCTFWDEERECCVLLTFLKNYTVTAQN